MTNDAESKAGFVNWHERASLWRKRAEQLQSIAEGMSDTSARLALTRQAAQWNCMATEAEGLAVRWEKDTSDAAHRH